MKIIKTKRVYEDAAPDDGYRIFVDRLWARGLKKEDLKYDLWVKDIGPSKELREFFHKNRIKNWDKFKTLYVKELENSEAINYFLEKIKSEKVITLLYASKDKEHNQVVVLKPYLEELLK